MVKRKFLRGEAPCQDNCFFFLKIKILGDSLYYHTTSIAYIGQINR